MLSRALVVLLLVLNLGVAAWILLSPDAPVAVAPATSPGVPTLRLVGEPVTGSAAPDPGAAAGAVAAPDAASADGADATAAMLRPIVDASLAPATPAEAEPPAASASAPPVASAIAPRCFTAGPYADAAAAGAARAPLLAAGATAAVARSDTAAARGWRVVIAPQATREAAVALAARLRADGFDDLLVINDGADANGIALGRYRGETAARQREASLRARSYEASAQAIGDVATRQWLDITAGSGSDDTVLRAGAAAPLQPRPCPGA